MAVAAVVVTALNRPSGGGPADEGKGAAPSSSSTPRSPASDTRGTVPGTGASPPAGGPRAGTRGTLLTTVDIGTVLGAFREASGNPQVKEVTVYEDYALAATPTKPGAKTYDEYQYRDGVARKTGPGGTIDPGAPRRAAVRRGGPGLGHPPRAHTIRTLKDDEGRTRLQGAEHGVPDCSPHRGRTRP